jgi:hypothetical protein
LRIDPLRRVLLAGWVLWSVAVLWGTLKPHYAQTAPPFPHSDKVMHMTGWLGLSGPPAALWAVAPPVVWAVGTAVGVAVEVAQEYIPGRSFEWLDLLADSAGAALGVWLGVKLRAVVVTQAH